MHWPQTRQSRLLFSFGGFSKLGQLRLSSHVRLQAMMQSLPVQPWHVAPKPARTASVAGGAGGRRHAFQCRQHFAADAPGETDVERVGQALGWMAVEMQLSAEQFLQSGVETVAQAR
jgi:hypothetical protein